MPILDSVKVIGEGCSKVHIESPAGSQMTLCGWTDNASGEIVDDKPTCSQCILIVKKCKRYKF